MADCIMAITCKLIPGQMNMNKNALHIIKMLSLSVQGIFVALIVGGLSFLFWSSFDPIHIVHSASTPTPVIRPGQSLIINATVTRTKYCISIVHRFIYHRNSNALVWSLLAPGGAAGVGKEQKLTLKINLPMLAVWDYIYRSYTQNDCLYRSVIARTPDVYFKVESVP